MLSLGISVVVEEVVVTSRDLSQLIHIVLNDSGDCIVEGVGGLTSLEEDVAVLCSTTYYRSMRTECTLTELTQSLLVDEWLEILVREVLDLLDLVRCAEAVEEVDERYAALDRCEVCYSSEVHNLLYRTRTELCETRHTSTHHVLVITKDRERLRCDRTSSYVVDAWE